MRNISQSALNKLSESKGVEPIIILGIEWTPGTMMFYSDKTVAGIRGSILELGELDSVVNVNGSNDSQSLSVVLSDTDGEIKDILDTNDIHLRPVTVYQYFNGLDITDKFILFTGRINSVIKWSESERTVSFTIISSIETREVGFSAEQGQIENLPPSLIGKPWPMCFGTVLHSPALRITEVAKGKLLTGIGISDKYLEDRCQLLLKMSQDYKLYYTNPGDNPFIRRYNDTKAILDNQKSTNRRTALVYNWSAFPQNEELLLKIGSIDGVGTQISSTQHKLLQQYFDTFIDPLRKKMGLPPMASKDAIQGEKNYIRGTFDRERLSLTFIPTAARGVSPHIVYGEQKLVGYRVVNTGPPWYSLKYIPVYKRDSKYINGDNSGYQYLKPGDEVTLATPEPQIYIVSLVPGEVVKVSVFTNLSGTNIIQDVDSSLYDVSELELEDGKIKATVVVFKDALSKNESLNCNDDIYVTFKSSVGPNTVDILRYLINTYTDFTIDEDTFNHVHERVKDYPNSILLNKSIDILSLLKDISWQARCSLILKNNVFYIYYLPEQPVSVATINEKDILVNTLEVTSTSTESLVTKLTGKWRMSHMQSDDFNIILRNNISKYGLKNEEYDLYTYNIQEYVLRCLSFWMIRYSNTWKIVKFKTPLHLLNIESLDSVTLDLRQISNQPVICKVLQSSYNSDDNTISMELWCPIKLGSMEPYIFAYPADLPSDITYPTDDDLLYYDYPYTWTAPQDVFQTPIRDRVETRFDTRNLMTGVQLKGPINPTMDEWDKAKNAETSLDKHGISDIDRQNSDIGIKSPSDLSVGQYEYESTGTWPAELPDPGPDSPGGMDPLAPDLDSNIENSPGTDPMNYGEDDSGASNNRTDADDLNDSDYEEPEDKAFNPEDLPSPEELDPEEWPCRAIVNIYWLDPITVVAPYSTVPGACGQIGAGTSKKQTYVFENYSAACAFFDSVETVKEGCVGETVLYNKNTTVDCSNKEYWDEQGGCTHKAENEYGMIGFDGGGVSKNAFS